jgi:hypothetical protein
VTANGNFGLARKRPKKEETSPGNSVTAEVLMGGGQEKLAIWGEKKRLAI